MKKVNVVYGTVYGSAQAVAELLVSEIKQLGYEPTLWQSQQLKGFVPPENELLVIVSSTTGQGDLPDDIVPWFTEIKNLAPYLPKLKYSVIALGDSSYETYCGAGKQFDSLFSELGATPIIPLFEIDAMETMDPEADALDWVKDLAKAQQ